MLTQQEQREMSDQFKDIGKPRAAMQAFNTGATRSDDSYKPDFEGFFSPLVMTAYAEYMQEHRIQDDGKVRASDNWQRGMPFHKYMKSLYRHFMQLWLLHRGYTPAPEKRAGRLVPVTLTSALAGVMFNTMGYFHEYLMSKDAWENRVVSEPEDGDKLTAKDIRKQQTKLSLTELFSKNVKRFEEDVKRDPGPQSEDIVYTGKVTAVPTFGYK